MDIISIVSPSFKHEKYLGAAIESVISQAGDFYIDYVIMDGGSPDASVDIIKHYEQWLEQHCDKQEAGGLTYYAPRDHNSLVKCRGVSFRWHSGPDKGQSDAINTAIDSLQGDYFAYLNSDDIYEPFALQLMQEAFRADAKLDVVYGNAVFIDADGDVIGAYPSKDINHADLSEQCYLSQPSVFIRMSTLRLAGKFNHLIRNSLDYEYWMRLRSMNAQFKFVQPVLSATRIHQDTKTNRNQMRIKLECLAIVHHYTGRIPVSWKVAFVRDASAVGIFTSRVLSVFSKLRDIKIRFLSGGYYLVKSLAVRAEERRLFKKEN